MSSPNESNKHRCIGPSVLGQDQPEPLLTIAAAAAAAGVHTWALRAR